jgi:4-amino-4-deoxy-L-arabinose transferase-like glycosyltransferase
MINEMSVSFLVYLWLAVLILFILWLMLRRWRQMVEEGVGDTASSTSSVQAVPQPIQPLSPRAQGQTLAAMMLGGLLLLLLGQMSYAQIPAPSVWFVWGEMLLGGGSFLWAGSRIGRQRVSPAWLVRKLHQVGHWFGIAGWQVWLLGLAALLALLARLAAGNEPLARQWDVSVVAWLLALCFCVVGGLPLTEAGRWLKRGFGLTRGEWWLLLALFVGAWLLRGTAVTSYPNTFSGDEGSAGLHTALFLQGKANNWFTIGWFSFPSLYYALQSVFIRLFGQTVEALRYFSALGGALAVVATYFLARVTVGKRTAVIAAIVLMSSHYHIHMSRIGLNNIWDSLFVALMLAGLWHGWHSDRRLSFLLAGLALGLGQYFYVSVRILPLLILLWVGLLFWRQPQRVARMLPHFVLSGFTAVLTVLPLALYFAGHWSEFQAPLNRVTIWGERLTSMAAASGQSQILIVLKQMGLTAMGFTHEPLRLLYQPGVPLLMPLMAGLFLVGLAWALLHFDERYGLLSLPLLGVVFLGGFSQDPPASQRFVVAMPATAVLVALPLSLLGEWLQKLWRDGKGWIWLGTAVLLSTLAFIDITFYFSELYDTYTLGGLNTAVATDIALSLQTEAEPPDVYFFGFPRMGYFSLATIPYLAPDVKAVDVIEPLTAPPEWEIEKPTQFIFLPDRLDELDFVWEAYETAVYEEVRNEESQLLYATLSIE